MKKVTIILLLFIAGQIFLSYGQSVTDYYRSAASGSWYEPSTWESSPDSSNWSGTSVPPAYLSKTIVISAGDTVSVFQSVIVDEVVVEAGGVLMIHGAGNENRVVFDLANGPKEYDMTVYGKVIATGVPQDSTPFSLNAVGVVSFEDGSIYEHNQNGGGIPIVQWQPGSTLILNAITDTPPANRAQNYSNIVVDLPNLTFNLNMGFRGNVISGDITILNTGVNTRWVLVGPVSDSVRTVTIMGNIFQSGGNFNSHGTENPNSAAVIHTFGDITVTGGNFSVVRGAQGGTGTTVWYLHGNLSISNATTQNGNPAGGRFVFKGYEEKTLTLENVTYGPGGLPIEVDDAALNIGNTVIGGEGIFTVNSGGILITSNPGGLDASIQTTGLVNLSTEADYVYRGSVTQLTGTRLPAYVNSLSVDNAAGVTLSADVQVTDTLNLIAGNLFLDGRIVTLGMNAMLVESEGSVKGTSGKIITTRDINAPASLNAGGLGAVITSSANLGTTLIERYHNSVPVTSSNSIYRQYLISPQFNTDLNATVRLYYLESELDTIQEENLRLYVSADGVSWNYQDAVLNTTDNYVEASGLSSLGFFTFGYGDQVVSVETESGEIPTAFSLYQNYPNPFNPGTVIKFDIPEEAFVNLSVYNAIGQKVITLIDERLNPGKYVKTFNAADLPSGMYIYKITSGKSEFVKKMILMK